MVDFYTFCTSGKRNDYPTTYLQSWWRHNCVTLHATKVYFIELYFLALNILSFELSLKIKSWSKTVKMKKIFCQKTDKKICKKNKKYEHIRWLTAKVAKYGFDRTHSRKWSATVVSKCDVFTLGSVETQLGWCCKFCLILCKVFIPVSISSKSIKIDQETPEL